MGLDVKRGFSEDAMQVLLSWKESRDFKVIPLTGDASNRRYYRIVYDTFTPGFRKSVILMERNAPEGFKGSEEKSAPTEGTPPGDAFVEIGNFLRKKDFPVPEIFFGKEDGSVLVQEDLGDETLSVALQHYPEQEEELRSQSLDLLLRLQILSPENGAGWIRKRSFSSDLYLWEFDHFLDYGIREMKSPDVRAARSLFESESIELASSIPETLLHRDYHSRNLMRNAEGRLKVIDFQDMRVGSPLYDLASFLFDAYRPVPEPLLGALVDRYYHEGIKNGILPGALSPGTYRNLLARHAFQRNLKACGRFFYIDKVKGNPSYLESVPQTHRNLEFLSQWESSIRPLWQTVRSLLKEPVIES
ncbi:MAG: aminoglycoside phosphotransferase family protein [Leptospirales bacterium]